jgi:hypothetical protein
MAKFTLMSTTENKRDTNNREQNSVELYNLCGLCVENHFYIVQK